MKITLFILMLSFILVQGCNKGKENSTDAEKSEQNKSEVTQKETVTQTEAKVEEAAAKIEEKTSELAKAVKKETTKAADAVKDKAVDVVEAVKKETTKAGDAVKDKTVEVVEAVNEETTKAADAVKEEVAEVVKEATGPDGAQLFQSKGCAGCHRPDNDVVGPSLKTIAKVYKEKNSDLMEYLKGEAKAIVVPKKAAMMKPLLNPIKSLSDEELKALADYILQ